MVAAWLDGLLELKLLVRRLHSPKNARPRHHGHVRACMRAWGARACGTLQEPEKRRQVTDGLVALGRSPHQGFGFFVNLAAPQDGCAAGVTR